MATANRQDHPSASRRSVLSNLSVGTSTHAGLWLDKYLQYQSNVQEQYGNDPEEVKEARATLMKNVAETIETPIGYRTLAEHRVTQMQAAPPSAIRELRFYKTTGRMVVGLGEFTANEVGIQLERTWGTPVIPGSALKGLAASVAHQYTDDDAWNRGATPDDKKGESHHALFGATDSGGKVTFHDAWWIPLAKKDMPFAADIMTVHHPKYYTESQNIPAPDGTESPVPVSFLSVKPGTIFAIALEASADDKAWLDAAWELLEHGLKNLGVGAKTSSGYGRLQRDTEEERRRSEQREQQRLLLAFQHGTIDEQLKIIVERAEAGLYEALRNFKKGETEARQFWELVPKNLIGFAENTSIQLADVDAKTFHTALKTALEADKEGWFKVLRFGQKPVLWILQSGPKLLKTIGDEILETREKQDTAKPEKTESESTAPEISPETQKHLDALEDTVTLTPERIQAAIDYALNECNEPAEVTKLRIALNPKNFDKGLLDKKFEKALKKSIKRIREKEK